MFWRRCFVVIITVLLDSVGVYSETCSEPCQTSIVRSLMYNSCLSKYHNATKNDFYREVSYIQ